MGDVVSFERTMPDFVVLKAEVMLSGAVRINAEADVLRLPRDVEWLWRCLAALDRLVLETIGGSKMEDREAFKAYMKDQIEQALNEYTEGSLEDPNSYGTGYDSGYLAGLQAALEAYTGASEGEVS